jgi:hypothetical protein
MKEKESLLKKEFKYRDVQRARNLIKKDYHAKTVEGVGYQKVFEERKEGDVWEEDGKTWTIQNGIKQTVSKLDKVRKSVTKPLHCPNCNSIMNNHLHNKMWKIHGMCYDCVINMENDLRIMGKFDAYERAMLTGNLQAWVSDMQLMLEEDLKSKATYITEQGDIEDWGSNTELQRQKLMETMQEYLEQVSEAINKLNKED